MEESQSAELLPAVVLQIQVTFNGKNKAKHMQSQPETNLLTPCVPSASLGPIAAPLCRRLLQLLQLCGRMARCIPGALRTKEVTARW